MLRLKRILNKFLPPSAETVQSYQNTIEQKIVELLDALEVVADRQKQIEEIKVDSIIKNLESIIGHLNSDFLHQIEAVTSKQVEGWTWERFLRMEAVINTQSDKLLSDLQSKHMSITAYNKKYYWNNPYEKSAIENNWGDLSKDTLLQDKYIKLIRGLDDISIRTINRILFRQSRFLSDECNQIDLFTLEEQRQLHFIDDEFEKEIVKIGDETYAYGHYLLPINHFEAVVFYYKYCLSELDSIEQIKGKTIIDAGAYIGDTALIFSELAPEKIVSFEPVQENIELCKKTVQMNGLTNVVLEQKALGSQAGYMDMYIAGEGSTSHPREEDRVFYAQDTSRVQVVTLDNYVNENQLRVGLIKADVEGSELDLLLGARQVISEQRPVLLICIYHNRHDFFNIKPILESWNLNYRFKIRKPVVPNATYETLLIAEPYDTTE